MKKKLSLFLLVIGFVFINTKLKAQWVAIPDANFTTYLQNNFPSCMSGNLITDLQGRKIGEGKFEENTSINVSQWQNGIYFIRLTDNITGLYKTLKLAVTQ